MNLAKALSGPAMNYDLAKQEANIQAAKDAGMTVIEGNSNTLLLDLDTQEGRDRFDTMFNMVNDKFGILHCEAWASKSGGTHQHIKLIIRESLSAVQRIALQAILGSDPKRECFGVFKSTKGIEEPSLLFKPGESK